MGRRDGNRQSSKRTDLHGDAFNKGNHTPRCGHRQQRTLPLHGFHRGPSKTGRRPPPRGREEDIIGRRHRPTNLGDSVHQSQRSTGNCPTAPDLATARQAKEPRHHRQDHARSTDEEAAHARTVGPPDRSARSRRPPAPERGRASQDDGEQGSDATMLSSRGGRGGPWLTMAEDTHAHNTTPAHARGSRPPPSAVAPAASSGDGGGSRGREEENALDLGPTQAKTGLRRHTHLHQHHREALHAKANAHDNRRQRTATTQRHHPAPETAEQGRREPRRRRRCRASPGSAHRRR